MHGRRTAWSREDTSRLAYHLGASVGRIRSLKKAATLDLRRVREIEQRYPEWVWDIQADHWQQQFAAAMDAFYAREGHARVPRPGVARAHL
jgi:hypothetical protein